MKLLVATRQSQGLRTGDFFLAKEGEIVRLPVFGQRPAGSIDPCASSNSGCATRPYSFGGALIGVDSGKGTTTVAVADIDIAEWELWHSLLRSYSECGWAIDVAQHKAIETLAIFRHTIQDLPVGLVLNTQTELPLPLA